MAVHTVPIITKTGPNFIKLLHKKKQHVGKLLLTEFIAKQETLCQAKKQKQNAWWNWVLMLQKKGPCVLDDAIATQCIPVDLRQRPLPIGRIFRGTALTQRLTRFHWGEWTDIRTAGKEIDTAIRHQQSLWVDRRGNLRSLMRGLSCRCWWWCRRWFLLRWWWRWRRLLLLLLLRLMSWRGGLRFLRLW